jgi:hypothetical protein
MYKKFMRLLSRWFKFLRGQPPAPPRDPYAGKLAPLKPRPKRPSAAVAVAEPDED